MKNSLIDINDNGILANVVTIDDYETPALQEVLIKLNEKEVSDFKKCLTCIYKGSNKAKFGKFCITDEKTDFVIVYGLRIENYPDSLKEGFVFYKDNIYQFI